MKIKIAGLVKESIVDGPGFRLAVFTQGCPHNCPGCHNPQTHNFEAGTWMDVSEIVRIAAENPLLDGITLSGGEPFCQAEACAEIAKAAKSFNLTVWSYTGYTFEQLLSGNPEFRTLLEQIDVLVDGPFIMEKRTLDMRFRGSSNQRLIDVKKSLASGEVIEFVL